MTPVDWDVWLAWFLGSVKSYADFRDRVHPEDIEGLEAARDAALRRRETYDVEYRVILPDGQVRWMLATGGAIYDEATGEPTRILGNNVDITLRKQAELALAERNAQLALAGRAALVGTYAYDVETETVQISEGYAAIFGFPEGTTELARSQWLARVHPEDLERAENLRDQAFRKRQGEYNLQYRIVLPGRGVRWIEARTFISYDGDGHPRRLVGVNIEVTERKRAEERQSVLVAELDHRVKNVLASVSAVVSNTRHESRSVPDFVAALDGRIRPTPHSPGRADRNSSPLDAQDAFFVNHGRRDDFSDIANASNPRCASSMMRASSRGLEAIVSKRKDGRVNRSRQSPRACPCAAAAPLGRWTACLR
jgi:PAS domain S-box-containing protein